MRRALCETFDVIPWWFNALGKSFCFLHFWNSFAASFPTVLTYLPKESSILYHTDGHIRQCASVRESGPKSHTIFHKSDILSIKQILLFSKLTPIVNRIPSPYHTSTLWCTWHIMDGSSYKPQGLHSLNLFQTNSSAASLPHHTSWPWIRGLFEVLHGHIGCCLLCYLLLIEYSQGPPHAAFMYPGGSFSHRFIPTWEVAQFSLYLMCHFAPFSSLQRCLRGDHPQKWNCTAISIYSLS